MNGNLAYQEELREEILAGKIYMMSSPSVNHNRVASHIFNAFFNYLKGKIKKSVRFNPTKICRQIICETKHSWTVGNRKE